MIPFLVFLRLAMNTEWSIPGRLKNLPLKQLGSDTKFLKKHICVGVLPASILCHCVQRLRRSEEGVGSPRTRVAHGCQPPCEC